IQATKHRSVGTGYLHARIDGYAAIGSNERRGARCTIEQGRVECRRHPKGAAEGRATEIEIGSLRDIGIVTVECLPERFRWKPHRRGKFFRCPARIDQSLL